MEKNNTKLESGEVDKELEEAVKEAAKVIEQKCGKKPYMLIVTKANMGFANEEDYKKGRLSGTSSYMFMSRPELRDGSGITKVLLESSEKAIKQAHEVAKQNPDNPAIK